MKRIDRYGMQLFLVLSICLGGQAILAQDSNESCINCHQNPDFLVTNKKLYDYFQDWRASVHGQEWVTCLDCHGGDPKALEKEKAHGVDMEAKTKGSAVNFANIPETCGGCHIDQLDAYKKSEHFQHLTKENAEEQGPNCVTCHGSLNSVKLTVNSVADVCSKCHNAESDNHPKIPEKAVRLLNDFNAIRGYRRFIEKRGKSPEVSDFLRKMDPDMQELAMTWHLFDLEKIDGATAKLLQSARDKRMELLKQKKKEKDEP